MPTSKVVEEVELDSETPVRDDASAPTPARFRPATQVAVVVSVTLVVVLVAATLVWAVRTTRDLRAKVASLERQTTELKKSNADLAGRFAASEGERPDVSRVSESVSPSVFTIEAGSALGSSWVAASGRGGSDLVTNFHVVEKLWDAGGRSVTIASPTKMMQGTVTSVSVARDLALIHVTLQLPALTISATKAPIGDPVIVFGSPFGLVGTVTTGVVSAYRTEQGIEYLQFSAAASPGSSGGPVVDHEAHVLGVVTQKVIETGAEGLSFAIKSSDVCKAFTLSCK